MLYVLLAAATLQSADAALPASPDLSEQAFTIGTPRGPNGVIMLAIGTPARSLSFFCLPGQGDADLFARFPETIGYYVRTGLSGGFRVRYSFDGAAPRGATWSGVGDAILGHGRRDGVHEVLRRLRGTTSIRLATRRRAARGEQTSEFAYPDPAPLVDEFARRCGLELER